LAEPTETPLYYMWQCGKLQRKQTLGLPHGHKIWYALRMVLT
jgi:hypothetical protein